jgi:thiamine kinase-like enzyme
MSKSLIVLVLLGAWTSCQVHATPDWPAVVKELQHHPERLDLHRIYGGASNLNYAYYAEGTGYFLRCAPPSLAHLYSDIEIEHAVLQQLRGLSLAPELVYFDQPGRILITTLLDHEKTPIQLRDSNTRKQVIAQLRRIEGSGASIERSFRPHQFVQQMLDYVSQAGLPALDPAVEQVLMPLLKKIEALLDGHPRRSLCHLDLHSKNILKLQDQVWFVDWEYAMMGHPYLVLASMASIERWDDSAMHQLVIDYDGSPSEQDLALLSMHRVAIDVFWGVWNHIQAHTSALNHPYGEWGRLFFEAAYQRALSPEIESALLQFDR